MLGSVVSFANYRLRDMENDEPDIAILREEILGYLKANPSAADSLEGIKSWWLTSVYKKKDSYKVEQVLKQLVAEGLVKKAALVDGTIIYKHGGRDGNSAG